ncbi:MAG: hypothetical protein E6X81_08055 [Clostridium butyricum]|nr:hypothetical protein [Clostridium butyricum]
MENRITSIENDVQDLKAGQERIERKLESTHEQVERTAEDITFIKRELTDMEKVTANNCYEIVRLKAIK